jgi:hypothetical protein
MFLQRCFWIPLKCYGMPLNGNCLIVTDVLEMRNISIFIVGKFKKSATWPWRWVQYVLPKHGFVIPTRHGEHPRTIFLNNQLDAQFFFLYVYFYSLHVSGSHVPIIRKINCINTTSGIVTLYRWLCGVQDKTHPNLHTTRPSIQCDIHQMSYPYN